MEGNQYINEMESHQFEDIYKSDDVPFHDLSKGVVKRLIHYGIGLTIILIILSFIVEIPREVHIPFVLKGGLNETIFQYPETTYIEHYLVEANDNVSIGDSLITLTSPRIVKYIEELETWQTEKEVYISKKKVKNEKTLSLVVAQINGLEKEIEKVEKEKEVLTSAASKETKNLENQLENAQNQHNRNNKLHKKEVISDSDFDESKNKVQQAEQLLISRKENYAVLIAETDSKLQSHKNNLSELRIELENYEAQFEYEISNINKQVELAEKKIRLNYGPFTVWDNALILISPVNGKVTLRSQNEHKIPIGDIILRIQTDSLTYYAYAEAGAKDIGHIKVNTKAVLKYESFPHYYYGTMRTNVLSVSNSPGANGLYPVKLEITDFGKLGKRITKGMTGTASFVVEERTVFNYVLRVFLKATTVD